MRINLNLPAPDQLDAAATLDIYHALRPFMPVATRQGAGRKAARLLDIIDQFDALILDGFGVINIGADKIDGIDEVLTAAHRKHIAVMVLTNGASQPCAAIHKKYAAWGLTLPHILSSRDALIAQWPADLPRHLNLVLGPHAVGFGDNLAFGEDAFTQARSFSFLGSAGWDEGWQETLEASLRTEKRPIFIGNPDISAPYPQHFSVEPGYWAARLVQIFAPNLYPDLHWFGKPHRAVFDMAVAQLEARLHKQLDRKKIAMVGDSLHTDILGGLAAGLATILITDYGLLKGRDVAQDMKRFGIIPDWHTARL